MSKSASPDRYAGPARARNLRAKRYAAMVEKGLSLHKVAALENVYTTSVSYMMRHACPPFVKPGR